VLTSRKKGLVSPAVGEKGIWGGGIFGRKKSMETEKNRNGGGDLPGLQRVGCACVTRRRTGVVVKKEKVMTREEGKPKDKKNRPKETASGRWAFWGNACGRATVRSRVVSKPVRLRALDQAKRS